MEVLRGAVVEVTSDRPFVVYADGDPIGATPVTMRVERRCLRVIVPRRLMFRAARLLARTLQAASRRSGKSGGTTAPGRLLLRLSPDALRRMAAELESGIRLLSATNGKTTTAAMIAAALERDGRPIVHNRAGSNMAWGVATALLDAGAQPGQLGLFEVDEAWLPRVARDVPPRLLLLANLFRDQLDRYGELEAASGRPLVGHRGRARRSRRLGAQRRRSAGGRPRPGAAGCDLLRARGRQPGAPGPPTRRGLQALPQLRCPLRLRRRLPRPPGRYRCPNCGRERPHPQVAATRVRLEGMRGSEVELRTPAGELTVRLPLPGLYNVYNAVAAAATALGLGVPLATVGDALAGFGGAFGRVETIPVEGRLLSILLDQESRGGELRCCAP